MSGHAERQVKVNALVDEGIAPLVEALSAIDGLVTIESCQGEPYVRDAFVIFKMDGWQATGNFLFEKLLPTLPPDLRAVTVVKLQAYDEDTAHGSIVLEPCAVDAVANLVQNISASAVGSGIFAARNTHRGTIA